MAQIAGTFSSYDAVGNREDLENAIYRITPQETPFITMIGTSKVEAVRHDWQTDTLATPAANAQIEGDDYTFSGRAPTTRVANFTQISWKPIIVTETQDAVKKAGRDTELGYQLAKASVELKKDIEFACLSNAGSVAGNDTTARVSGGFPAWLETNVDRGAGGADGGFDANTGLVAAATDGTQRAYTKALMDNVIQSTYQAGGNPTTIMVSPYNKRIFSTFMSDAKPITNESIDALIPGADIKAQIEAMKRRNSQLAQQPQQPATNSIPEWVLLGANSEDLFTKMKATQWLQKNRPEMGYSTKQVYGGGDR